VDVQRNFPPIRHSLTGGPIDEKSRIDLYDEIGWLARKVQVLEGPSGLSPSEAVDRLLDRVTGRESGEVDVQFAINELRKHCGGSGVHCLEIGEPDKAGAFEEYAGKFESLHARYFSRPASSLASEVLQRTGNERFSQQHRLEFQELLAAKLELRAINSHPESLDFGPWKVGYLNGDSADPQHRMKGRFRAAAKKAAIAAGAPPRANVLDWWISKLAGGKKLHCIQGLIKRSADLCAELESNAVELRPLVGEIATVLGLRRDRYPCDEPVPYSLYAVPHLVLPDPGKEFAFWEGRIWGEFARSIDEVARWRRHPRRWIDTEGKMHVEPNDAARLRVRERVEKRTELLSAWILGLSYDLAVVQANYIIDRGLRAEEAIRAFELESSGLVERVRQAWRDSAKKWGLSWKKLEQLGTDFAKPFREVGADLRELILTAFTAGRQSPPRPDDDLATRDPFKESIVSPDDGLAVRTERGKARSDWLDRQLTARGWTSDKDIESSGGPTYNTIQRYRSGEESTRDRYVRGKFATAFACAIPEVPA
jgi:hypothetical protein